MNNSYWDIILMETGPFILTNALYALTICSILYRLHSPAKPLRAVSALLVTASAAFALVLILLWYGVGVAGSQTLLTLVITITALYILVKISSTLTKGRILVPVLLVIPLVIVTFFTALLSTWEYGH